MALNDPPFANRNLPRPAPNLPGVRPPQTSFQEVRDRRRAFPLYFDVDLSVARSFAAGTHLKVPAAGNSIYIDNDPVSVGFATLRFLDNESVIETPFRAGPGFNARIPFTGLVFENAAQVGLRLRVIYGTDVEFQPNLNGQVQLTGGVSIAFTVAGAPQGLDLITSTAHAFAGWQNAGALAGNQSVVGITNPAGSGKRIYVDSYGGLVSAVQQVQVFLDTDVKVGAGALWQSKLAGGAAGIGRMRFGNGNGLFAGAIMDEMILPAPPGLFEVPLREPKPPYILDPGTGLYLATSGLNTVLNAKFQGREY